MVRRLQFVLSSILVLIFSLHLLISSPALAGLNLCIGDNGHLELGTDESDCCPPVASGFEASFVVSKEVCLSCIDVALGDHGFGPQAIFKVHSPVTFFHPALLEYLQPFQPAPTAHLSRILPSPPTLTAIQTVVLRV